MIIDHHVHLGVDSNKTKYTLSKESLLEKMDIMGVDKSIVFPCPNIPPRDKNPYLPYNQEIKDQTQNQSRLIPFMFVHPYLDDSKYISSMKESFKGFKLYNSAKDMEYEYNNIHNTETIKSISSESKPLIVHTSLFKGGRARDLIPFIQSYSGPVAVAHIARMSHSDLELISKIENVYIDLSPFNTMLKNPHFLSLNEIHPSIRDLNPIEIIDYLTQMFGNRIVWGTDSPWCDNLNFNGYKEEVDIFKELVLSNICSSLV
jgi:hypothetical protein